MFVDLHVDRLLYEYAAIKFQLTIFRTIIHFWQSIRVPNEDYKKRKQKAPVGDSYIILYLFLVTTCMSTCILYLHLLMV